MTVKHFNKQADCSAIVVDWKDLDSANRSKGSPVIYFGNYADDDYNEEYALFGIDGYRFCIKTG